VLAVFGVRGNQQRAGVVEVWDPETGSTITLDTGGVQANAARLSPDGTRVVIGSADQTAAIWDLATRRKVVRLDGHGGYVWDVGYSHDGNRIVTGSGDRTVRVWDAATGELLATSATSGAVRRARFLRDGEHVAITIEDWTLRVWDVHLETRAPAVIDELVARTVPWRLVDGRLVDTPTN
jgi:WD40 repeat protein